MTFSPFQSSTIGTVRRAGDRYFLERSDSGWGNAGAFAAISRDGQVVVWGDPAKGGQLDGATATLLSKQTDVPWKWTVELAASSGAFAARRANGQVVAWGDSAAGGTIPADLAAALHEGVVRVFGLANGFAALKADGRLITWGPGPGTGQSSTDLDLSKPYKVVTSFDSLAILQDGRLVGCWGGTAGASQWAQHAELRSALNSGVLELVCNDAGFAARTATGEVITWGVPVGIGDANGVSISNRPDIVKLGSETYEFHGFDDKGQIWIWRGFSQHPWEQPQYVAGSGPMPWPYFFQGPITEAQRFFYVSGGGMGWSLKDDYIWLYHVGGSTSDNYQVTIATSEPVLSGTNGLAVIDKGNKGVKTFGYELNLNSPNSSGFFSTVSKPADATWQAVRATSGAFAALASDGHVGLWGDAASGASPANPALTQQLLQQHLPQALFSNQGAFVALAADGTAISWGQTGTGGDANGVPQIFSNIDHIVSPWANVRIDEQGSATQYNLIINGQSNPEGQTIPLLVQEGDQLSVVIQNDPNGDRVDTTGNVYTWQRNGQASGDNKQASINLDALSTGAWSVTPTYLDLPGFSRTLAPLNVQVQMVDNGQASVSIRPFEFNGPSDQAFSAGNGKVTKLVATIAGDPEGIKSIDAVQWFRNDTPIKSDGTPARSILLAEEPGSYSFEATYNDTQGYQRTIHSGRVQIDPAGGVPSQSHLATGGLQTLWRLAGDGRSVERLDSSSLRMRAVDMAGKAGYLAISASSDNRAWALDNEGFACVYDGASNRFIRQDGSGNGNNQQLNLGSGWRQIVAARGSSSAPALWLLRDAPLDGGSNVAYLPGALAQGQTPADLKPITLNAGPQLRLLAVGEDQTPWGIDQAGNVWTWDAANSSFGQLAAGVGSRIRQLQMIDQATVWALDDQGILQMWDGEKKVFKAVPLDSPFWTRRNSLITPGATATWESFSLSKLGGFVGIPRTGVTTPTGGTGLVCFDTSEIRMLTASSENIGQIQLLSGSTLQDNGTILKGQNLIFTKNESLGIAYMLPGGKPGQWEGASVIPKAQSGSNLRIESGPAREDRYGQRLPSIKATWETGLEAASSSTTRISYGYISPFGGLIFTQARPKELETGTIELPDALEPLGATALVQAKQYGSTALAKEEKEDPSWKSNGFKASGLIASKPTAEYSWEKETKGTTWDFTKGISISGAYSYNEKSQKDLDLKLGASYKWTRKASKKSWWNTGGSNTLQPLWLKKKDPDFNDYRDRTIERTPVQEYIRQDENGATAIRWGGGVDAQKSKINTKEGSSKLAFSIDIQATQKINLGTGAETGVEGVSLSFKLDNPLYAWGLGIIQLSMTLGLAVDMEYEHNGFSIINVLVPRVELRTPTGENVNTNTPETDINLSFDSKSLAQVANHPVVTAVQEQALPVVEIIQDYIEPILSILRTFTAGPTTLKKSSQSHNPFELAALNFANEKQSHWRDYNTELTASLLQDPKFSISLKPFISGKLKIDAPFFNTEAELKFTPTNKYDTAKGWTAQASLDLSFRAQYLWFSYSDKYSLWNTTLRDAPSKSENPSAIFKQNSSNSAFNDSIGPEIYALSAKRIIRDNFNTHATSVASNTLTPIAQLARANGDAIGITTQLLSNNTGLYELYWIKGKQRSDGLTFDWDTSSAQRIEGSAGFTSSIRLTEYGSHDASLMLPGQRLVAGQYLLSSNGRYMALMQSDGNFVVQTLRENGSWAVSFSLNDYRNSSGQQPTANISNANTKLGSTPGTWLELRNGKLTFLNAAFKTSDGGNAITLDGGTYQRGDKWGGGYLMHQVATNDLAPGTSLQELRLSNDGVLIGTATDGRRVFSFERFYDEARFPLSPSAIPQDKLTGLQSIAESRLAISASHIAADDPLLKPITQLAPGTLYQISYDAQSIGRSITLDASASKMGLPSERIWSQLGSSLASSHSLRSDWSGDSLIAGASGSNNGAGALYILNGQFLNTLSDLSTLPISRDVLLPGQQLRAGEYLLSANGRYIARMQDDGNFLVGALDNSNQWIFSFTLNDYTDKNLKKATLSSGSWLELRNGQLTFVHPDGSKPFTLDGGYVQRSLVLNVRTAPLPDGTRLSELRLTNDGILEAKANDGSTVFSFDRWYPDLSSQPIPEDRLVNFNIKNPTNNSVRGLVLQGSHQSGSLSGLGQMVINGGDTNRDGFNEILAAAPHDEAGAGLVYMLYGGYALQDLPAKVALTNKTGAITLDDLDALQQSANDNNLYLQTFAGVGNRKGYGTILAGGHDLNGDRHSDLLIGYAADSNQPGHIELWSSRTELESKDFQGGVLDGPKQSIPHFDRSILVSARAAVANQSDFHLHAAASVGDLNADGRGEIVLSSDSQAALVFGDALMPVYWEASAVLGSIAAVSNPASKAPISQTWTASWRDSRGQRHVLSFSGADRNNDGLISTVNNPKANSEVDWVALRIDGEPAEVNGYSYVALSDSIAHHWSGSHAIKGTNLTFNVDSKTFTQPVSLSASTPGGDTPFSWSSADPGVSLDQGARSLQARLLTSNAPGVMHAAGIGDFNGDGRPDLALSQAGYRVPNSDGSALVNQPGQTAVVFGNATLASTAAPLPLEQTGLTGGPTAGVLLRGSGGELSAIGDWNRDGKADLLLRQPSADGTNGAEQAGTNVVLLGRTDSLASLELNSELQAGRAQILQGSVANSLSGTSAVAGDFSGYGSSSLIVGAPNTIREADLRRAAAGMRVLTATQKADGSWSTPQSLPEFGGAAQGQQQLSTYTAVGNRILATWVHSRSSGETATIDELWVSFQDPISGEWTPAHKLQQNTNSEIGTPSIGEVQTLALTDASTHPTGAVLMAWTTLDATTGRTFLFQSTYDPRIAEEGLRWSAPQQQDPDALLLANQDAISGSQLKLQLNPGTPEQRSQIWAGTSVSSEGQTHATITLLRSGDLSEALTLTYSTRDRSASAGSQYQHSSGSVTFTSGSGTASVAIPLIDNALLEHRATAFAVDFTLPEVHANSAQVLLGNTPVATTTGAPVLSVGAAIKDNDVIQMRAIDAGISLTGPLTGSTGAAATASTAVNPIPPSQQLDPKSNDDPTPKNDPNLTNSIALVADPGANEGLGQVYGLFVAARASSAANPGMDWKELNDIDSLDKATQAQQGDNRQLNVLIQPEAALAALDPRAGFGTAMVKLRLKGGTNGSIGESAFAISAPGNPLDGTKTSRIYVVTAKTIENFAKDHPLDHPLPALILTDSNALIIEQTEGGLFGSVLSAADLDGDGHDELIVGAPGASTVSVISGSGLLNNNNNLLVGRKKPGELAATVIHDSHSTETNRHSSFGAAIAVLDLDGDKHLDLAIGAPLANPVSARTVFDGPGPVVANAGAVYVIKGTGNIAELKGIDGDIHKQSSQLTFKGLAYQNARGDDDDPPRAASEGSPPPGSFGFGEQLGTALAAVDLNADGIKDLAIGAPQYTPDYIMRTGRVVTWFGGNQPWNRTTPIDLFTVDANLGVSFVGQQASARVGSSLAAAGDLQRDGHDDLAIGAPFEDGSAGRVYVAFGSSNRYSKEAFQVTGNRFQLDSTNPDSPFQTFEAPDGYQLGQSVVGLGDVNNDSTTGIGGMDLFLGSPAAVFGKEIKDQKNGDITIEPAGQTHMAWGRPWLGPNQSLDVPFTQGVGYLLPFGGVPLSLGDLNGDGYGDYALLGSDEDWLKSEPSQQADASKLRIRFGAAVEYEQQQVLLSQFDLPAAATPLAADAYPLVASGDFDGDGFGDVVALTQAGLRVLRGAPNLSVQGDSQGHWNTAGDALTNAGAGTPISLLSSGDFDGDGFDDLVVVNQNKTLSNANPTLSIFWGSATGLQAGGHRDLTPLARLRQPSIDGLIALDSNGDGVDELALYGNDLGPNAADQGWSLQLLALDRRNTENPFKRAVQGVGIGTGLNGVPSALSSGDLNSDGFSDLLIDHGGNTLSLLLGDRQWYLKTSNLSFIRNQKPTPQAPILRSQLARFIGDTNADGHDDLLLSPTSPTQLITSDYNKDIKSPPKHGPFSFVYLGTTSNAIPEEINVPAFSKPDEDNSNVTAFPRADVSDWAKHYGYVVESLPGEAKPYRTGGIGDVNGDGFDEVLFSSNSLYVGDAGVAEQRPHSIALYGTPRLAPPNLSSTTTNDGSRSDDVLHQLGSAGKQELLLRGKAGGDLLQVHADPYGATLSIPKDGTNAGRLTVSASNGTTLWSQPRNPYELVLKDGQLQIIHHTVSGGNDATEVVKAWGRGVNSRWNYDVDRVFVDPIMGGLYLISKDATDVHETHHPKTYKKDPFSDPESLADYNTDDAGFTLNLHWAVGNGLFAGSTSFAQLLFFPQSGRLSLVNRGDPDLRKYPEGGGYPIDTDVIDLFEGDGALKGKETFTQVIYGGESLLSDEGSKKLASKGINLAPMPSLNQLEASRQTLSTFLTDYGQSDQNSNTFGLLRNDNRRSGEGGIFSKDFRRVLGDAYSNLQDGWAWVATKDANGKNLQLQENQGPLLVAMDGNGRLTINAQQKADGLIKPGSELAVLHEGNPDPFLPPIGSEPVLLRPGFSSDQITQAASGSRSTNNSFTAVLKGGLDDDRLGIDSLQRFINPTDGSPAGLVDGGPGVDTLFFSSQRSDGAASAINLVGFGSRIRNIEAIEIPINNTLVIDEAPLLNTPLHRLKLESRGAATVTFHVREAYQFIGDQLDAGLAYSVYAKANSNLQLWVQQGRVNLNQVLNASGTSGGLTTNQGSEQIVLQAAVPHDPNGLAVDPQLAYRWYAGDALIAGATAPTYSLGDRDEALSTSLQYQIDYTDGHGLRQTVTSAPIVIDTAQRGQPGSLRVLRTRLEEPQRTRLEARLPGSQADPELVLAHRSGSTDQRPATIQRITLAATPVSTAAPDPAGLVALLDPSESWPNPVTSAEVYDFNKDGRLDTLSWDTTGFTAGPTELRTGLLRGPAAQLALLPNGSIGFVLSGSEAAPTSVSVAALQSLRVNLLNAPAQVGAVVAIALNAGETLSDLSALERRQRAITLLSNQDHDPAPLTSGADKERQLWLRADQALVLLELNGTTPLDWDGTLPGAPLAPADPLPESGLAGNRLQLSGTSGLRLELEALTTPQTIDSAVSRSQGRAPLLDFRGLDGLTLQASLEVAREAAFTTTMGFYAIDAIDGSIRDPISGNLVNPADPSYHALATANRVEALDGLQADNRSSNTRNLNLSESRLLAPYAVVADPVHGSQTYYAFAEANSDGIGHFRSFGSNVIGLEDQRFGGDNDFDDNMIHLAFSPVLI